MMTMMTWRVLARLALALGCATSLLAGCACDSASSADLTGVPPRKPDKIEAYENIDGHPNVVRLCVGGLAFATTSRENGQNFLRVPEWDESFCGSPPAAYPSPSYPVPAPSRSTPR